MDSLVIVGAGLPLMLGLIALLVAGWRHRPTERRRRERQVDAVSQARVRRQRGA